jgi:SAM-dependent methyltransferase
VTRPPASERNRAFYESYWRSDFTPRQRLWREWWQEAYDQALAWAGPIEGKRVLNVFAGHGADAQMLQSLGAEVVALDFARSGLTQWRPPPWPVCADATQMPLADASFDLVFLINGLCHTEKRKTLAECRRVLKPGGRVLLIEVMRWPHVALLARLCDPFFWKAPHRFLSVGELKRLAKGFTGLRHREFFLLSVLSVIALRVLPRAGPLRAVHRGMLRVDRRLLKAAPFLGNLGYLCAAELRTSGPSGAA